MLQFSIDNWPEDSGLISDHLRLDNIKCLQKTAVNSKNDSLESSAVTQDDSWLLKMTTGTGSPAQNTTTRGGLAGWQIKRLKHFIDNELDNSISVHALSNIASLSPSHFAHAFRTSFGIAPHRYVVFCRLRKATNLIMESELSLCEIALICGFADQPHLCRIFKKHFSQTPVAWRRQKRAEYGTVEPRAKEYVAERY
jgi:AraC-like DNA-binding protein